MNIEYTLLDSDEKIIASCISWENIEKLAVDFECEFNLHVYGEHLCIVQIYDGDNFYIIDAKSKDVTVRGLERFFSLKARKIWFDCQSDHALVYKNYGLRIENIFDLRVLAQVLGFQGNLISLEKEYLDLDIAINKKKNQQANWLKRPISEENLRYALMDVAYLFPLEEALKKAIDEKKLEKNVLGRMKHVTAPKEPEPGWMHIGSWKHYSESEKELVKNIFIARDSIAKRFNVPASRVMDKHKIIELVKNKPRNDEELEKRLEGENPRFIKFLVPAMEKAFSKSNKA